MNVRATPSEVLLVATPPMASRNRHVVLHRVGAVEQLSVVGRPGTAEIRS
ncbi:MAG: hypothetical protein ACJAQ3_003598, partial [Planctomycetota bacterium]